MATQKPFLVNLATSLTLVLLLLNAVNSAEVVSFTFTKFQPNQPDLLLQGDAEVVSSGQLQLTKVDDDEPVWNSTGRALYTAPIHMWDPTTDKVANFLTSFSFIIRSPVPSKAADGMAFFLAPLDTEIQQGGGRLGLFESFTYNKSSQIVAVEFDTHHNNWDPSNRHIGIDVNSIVSNKTVPWVWENGKVANVFISYQASTKTLTASLTYPMSQKSYIVSTFVDVKNILPEFVRVGFSASTGLSKDASQTNEVLSWSFTSTFENFMGLAEENDARLGYYDA